MEEVKKSIQGSISSNDEYIIDVVFKDKDLWYQLIWVIKILPPLHIEDLAISHTS